MFGFLPYRLIFQEVAIARFGATKKGTGERKINKGRQEV
jgi:hypothetical protein